MITAGGAFFCFAAFEVLFQLRSCSKRLVCRDQPPTDWCHSLSVKPVLEWRKFLGIPPPPSSSLLKHLKWSQELNAANGSLSVIVQINIPHA